MSLSYQGTFQYAGRSTFALLGIVLHYANNADLRLLYDKPGLKHGKAVTNVQTVRSCIEIHISISPFLIRSISFAYFPDPGLLLQGSLKFQPVLCCLKALSIIVYIVYYGSNLDLKIRAAREYYKSLLYTALLGAIPHSYLPKLISQGFTLHFHS